MWRLVQLCSLILVCGPCFTAPLRLFLLGPVWSLLHTWRLMGQPEGPHPMDNLVLSAAVGHESTFQPCEWPPLRTKPRGEAGRRSGDPLPAALPLPPQVWMENPPGAGLGDGGLLARGTCGPWGLSHC